MSEHRLIDANALKKHAMEMEIFMPYGGDGTCMAVPVISIDNAPTIDAVPVVHGRWNPSPYTEKRAKCSNCEVSRDIYTQIAWNYCPNCGAKMDGGAE